MPRSTLPASPARGMSLIEVMVAMALGILVALGIVNIFTTTSSSSLVQAQLARLQEGGRFAITSLTNDLRMANAQYCSNMGGPSAGLSNGALTLDRYLRAPKVILSGATLQAAMQDVTTSWGATSGTNTYPAAPTTPFILPSWYGMRGYDCTTTACTPVDPKGPSTSAGVIPAQGTATGNRVLGSDILTIRYLNGTRGWTLDGTGSTMTVASQVVTSISLTQKTGEPPVTDIKSGDLMMLADCNASQVFSAKVAGTTITADSNYTTLSQPTGVSPRLFDFNRDYQTVTYYLQVVDDNDGNKTGALMRRLNGVSSEVVRGVERLDFLYGVMDAAGNTSFRTAADIDSATSCASSSPGTLGSDPGCLWRSVQSIEVHVLMDGQKPLYALNNGDMQYQYYGDTAITGLASPDDANRTVKPSQQGFDNHMLRREFTTLVSVRNYNP
ncbi:PilW family protein [Luteibacter sp.]|uniref:PilW family protein n=1 Tax=Luteibacter sp. TaxID=1886636 RepID=UPI003F8024BD